MNINFGINFDGLLRFKKEFWVLIGEWVSNTIRADARKGIYQTDEPVKTTYSPQYAKLKANGMQEQTTNAKGKTKSEKVKSLQGVSIVSRNTSFVDMTLTGQTLRGLKITETFPNGVQVSFNIRDLWKIVGNQKPGLNRRLVGLNNKNMKRLQELFINEVATQVGKNFVGKTVLNFKL
jgi:hypothetical protein